MPFWASYHIAPNENLKRSPSTGESHAHLRRPHIAPRAIFKVWRGGSFPERYPVLFAQVTRSSNPNFKRARHFYAVFFGVALDRINFRQIWAMAVAIIARMIASSPAAPFFIGLHRNRAGGIRTHDLLNPIQALYQAEPRPVFSL